MLAENLKSLRKERKLSQQKIADILGIPQRRYSNYETGTSEPNVEMLIKIADYYKVSVDYLIGRYKQ